MADLNKYSNDIDFKGVQIQISTASDGGLICEVKARDRYGILRYTHIFPPGIAEAEAKNLILEGLEIRQDAMLHPKHYRAGRPKKQNPIGVSDVDIIPVS